MDHVFISYARKDQQFVRILYDVLQRNNRSAWVDWRDIPPSAEWLQEVYAAIESAENFIFVISPDSIVSETCALEINYAQKLQKRIIPLICRDVDTSKAAAPISKLFFSDQYQSLLQSRWQNTPLF